LDGADFTSQCNTINHHDHFAVRTETPDGCFPESPVREQFEGRQPMAGKCDVCGKAKTFGNNVSFSKRRTNRDFRPNVQSKKFVIDGVGVKVNICTRCLRTMGKSGRVA